MSEPDDASLSTSKISLALGASTHVAKFDSERLSQRHGTDPSSPGMNSLEGKAAARTEPHSTTAPFTQGARKNIDKIPCCHIIEWCGGFCIVCRWYPVVLAALACFWLAGGPSGAQVLDGDLPERAHALRQVISTLEAEAAELEPKLEAARGQLADLNRQITEATGRLESSRNELAALGEDKTEAEAAITQARTEAQDQQTALDAMNSELAEVTAQVEAARAELGDIADQRNALQAHSQELASRIAEQEGQSGQMAQDISRMNDELAAITQARTEAQDQQTALDDMKSELAEVTAQLDAARAELGDIAGQRNALQAQSAELATRIVEQEPQPGQLDGNFERLSSELAAMVRERDAAEAAPEPVAPAAPPATADAGPAPRPADGGPGQRRNPAVVDAALAQAPALPEAPLRNQLRDLLIDGHCATEALAQVQDPINRQTLVALVGRLGGC